MPLDPADPALALVHEGWHHLRNDRPLAAWASWRRALQVDPDQPAARAALERLAHAPDLPASARREYSFRPPTGVARRARWDAKLRGRDLSDLALAADVFDRLASEDPIDGDAAYNAGLCLAWLGRNAEAISCLWTAIDRMADVEEEVRIRMAVLAEILRAGRGAERGFELPADVSEAIEVTGIDDPAAVVEWIGKRPLSTLRRLPSPVDPNVDPSRGETIVAEMFRFPWPEPSEKPLRLGKLPRVRAVIVASGNTLRFSSPTGSMGSVPGMLARFGLIAPSPTRSPLPLALLDAAAWVIRIPDWVDEESRRRLLRENVEDYYENRWIVSHRIGETPGSWEYPLGIAPESPRLRARLEAMIRLREELAARPSSVALYQGYPFDRLRHRLGLPPRDPIAIDPVEIGFMTGKELDALDIGSLDDHSLADAYRSAVPLGDDARAGQFALALLERRSEELHRLAFTTLLRCLDHADPDWKNASRLAEAMQVAARDRGGFNRLGFEFHHVCELFSRGEPNEAFDRLELILPYCDVEHLAADRIYLSLQIVVMELEPHLGLGPANRALKLGREVLEVARKLGDPTRAARLRRLLFRDLPGTWGQE